MASAGPFLLSTFISTLGSSLPSVCRQDPSITQGLMDSLGKNFDKVSSLVAVAWPALLILGAIPVAFIQQALFSMTDGQGRAEAIEPHRVRYSTQSGPSLALAGGLRRRHQLRRQRAQRQARLRLLPQQPV